MEIPEGLTYDDILLVPQKSDIRSRKDVDTSSFLTKHIKLNIPIISANMDTVTEHKTAIAMARAGGIGIVHRFMSIERQVNEILKVKRAESIAIEDPYTVDVLAKLKDALAIMRDRNVTSLIVVDSENRIEGILTNRDVKFEDDLETPVASLMTGKDNLVVAEQGIDIDSAKLIFKSHKIEKLPVVDKDGHVMGLITSKDILKRSEFPVACKDEKGRLRVGAAIGVRKGDYMERAQSLVEAGCDVLVVDIAHGHATYVMDVIKDIRRVLGDIPLVAGNVVTKEATEDLISAGADAIKVGIGPGAVCTTRIVSGSGYPQFSAVLNCVDVAGNYGVPVIADGGIKFSGDIAKAIGAGASSVMIGNLIAGTDEVPGMTMMKNGQKFKIYRGMASYSANLNRKENEIGKVLDEFDYNPEGVESTVPYKGSVSEVLHGLINGLRSGMTYSGASNIRELQKKARFVRITASGIRESHPHDVRVM